MGLLGRLREVKRSVRSLAPARLGGLPPPVVAIRTPLFHPDVPVIVLWSQKAGCTTALTWFLAQAGLLDEAAAHSPWLHRYENEVFKARDGYQRDVARALADRTHHVIKVVRDPLRRAPSGFFVLAEKGARLGRTHWVQDHWREVDRWLAARGRDPAKGLSFLDHLQMVAEFEARGAHAINRHLSPQHVRGEDEVIDEVVPIERFAAWARDSAPALGLRAIDPASLPLPAHHHGEDARRTAALGPRPETVPIRRAAYADGRFPAAAAFLSERTIPAIRAAYAPDFAAYGALYGL